MKRTVHRLCGLAPSNSQLSETRLRVTQTQPHRRRRYAGKQAAQWAYPETCVLGRNAGHPHVWTPDEVWPILAGLLAAAREPLA